MFFRWLRGKFTFWLWVDSLDTHEVHETGDMLSTCRYAVRFIKFVSYSPRAIEWLFRVDDIYGVHDRDIVLVNNGRIVQI